VNTEPSHQQLNILLKYYQDGQNLDAEKLALTITKEFPKHQFAWKVLTAIYIRTNKISAALYTCQKSVQLNPYDIGSLNNLGFLQFEQGKFDEAEASYKKVLTLNPNLAETYNNLGNTFNEQGKFDEAEASFKKAILLKPEYVDVYYNMGVMLNNQRKFNEAELNYKKALKLKPNHVEAYNNLGNTLNEQGKFDEAEASFKKAISLKPDHVEAYNNLGKTLNDQNKFIEAKKNFDKAIILKNDYTQSYYNLGITLQQLGKIEKAIENYDKAIKLNPHYSNAYHNKNLCLNYSSSYSPSYIYKEHLKFEKKFARFNTEQLFDVNLKKKLNERLRIGYVSGDFREHSVAYFFKPLLENHNNNIVETFCYYNNTIVDKITKKLMSTCDNWRSIYDIEESKVSNLIKNDKINILVDLSGHTANNRLLTFAQKPAPIQVTWLGYPNTTGLSAIDYRLTDIIADPINDTDKFYSEKLLRLPNGFQCFQGNEKVIIKSELLENCRNYITFGSFNNLSKITPQVINVWSKILHLVPKSHLILKCSKIKYNKDYFLNLFKDEGLTTDRIELFEQTHSNKDHLELYNSIDIGLDPFPYNGATTTCEALWMGVPVISLFGDRHVGRVGASILTNVGLKDFIAEDIDSYIKLAIKVSTNINYLKNIKKTLRERMQKAPLCDAQSFANDIENTYKKIWLDYQKTIS